MPEITEAEYKLALKSRRGGVFVLCGEEDYLIRHGRRMATEPYEKDASSEFNCTVVNYASASDAEYITASASSLPLFGSLDAGKLVEVAVEDPSSLSASDTDALIGALSASSGYEGTTVLFCITPGTLDLGTEKKRSEAYKKLVSAEGVNVVYYPRSTQAQLRRWIERHFAHEGLFAEPGMPDALLSFSGTGMTALSNEIDKLTAYVKSRGRDRVTADDVRAICCRVDAYDAFALSNAVLDGRQNDALEALEGERARKTEPVVVSAGISRTLSDMLTVKLLAARGEPQGAISSRLGMHSYKVGLYMNAVRRKNVSDLERCILLCSEADRQIKTSGGGYTVLEKLIASVVSGG